MDHYVRIYMRTSFWWWLFSTNIECNPTILKMVDDEMILWTFTRFSPGVHPISLLFYSILASKFTIFRGFCKMCAFCVYTKKMTHYFLTKLTSCFYSLSERTAIVLVCALGFPEVMGKVQIFLKKYSIIYTQNQANFCWFQIVVFFLTIGTDWMMKKKKSF